ncbi:hypothetical protein PR202_gb06492 [Eleusine coracana subsp. coracana]|uniref:Uncharacterized protein n=1 Tax=Eleusine coracana subsp. coracana TaxID=191504 RepID=A0AAV5E799_ELECO|nr:hypothetical protein PR202_gb06492 [Eleusine coracana subsp. coracana]
MAMEDGGGASSSMVQQQQPLAAFGHGQPPPFWSTPTPYLFIGFAVVMTLIAVALAVLLCSRRKEDEEEEARRRGEGREVLSVRVLSPLDREDAAVPRVVVVMAGDHAPSFLASAVPFATSFAVVGKATPAQMPAQHDGGDKDKNDDAASVV